MGKLKVIFGMIILLSGIQSCTEMDRDTILIGHRGAMGHETENTLASVQKALDLQVDMIEIDVFKISSGEIVVFHDKKVERLTDGEGKIEDFQLEELSELKLTGNHRIPLLVDVLDLIDKQVSLNIELKGANTSAGVDKIIQAYIQDRGWKLDQFIISSFNWDELRSFRRMNQDIAIAVLTEENPLKALPVALELRAEPPF